ncbi:hypothetical protein RRG08_044530 [Elysia crispata]|uniref:G-protein coupled receptors family 1 profile domain-containing protein n=1 Tax=Elysia crispata TaxID=231223 RepID=A0AAE0ZCG4_9GAST|nr:hypothetical protein RRG08_044530 [Elysia crispata]
MRSSPPDGFSTTLPCDAHNTPHLLTSDLNVITLLTVVVAVMAVFTLFANCIIIAAISRAYMHGISAGREITKSPLTATRGLLGQGNTRSGQRPLTSGQGNMSPGQEPLTSGQANMTPGKEPLTSGQGNMSPGQEPLTDQGNRTRSQEPLTSGQGNTRRGQESLSSAQGNRTRDQEQVTLGQGNWRSGQEHLTSCSSQVDREDITEAVVKPLTTYAPTTTLTNKLLPENDAPIWTHDGTCNTGEGWRITEAEPSITTDTGETFGSSTGSSIAARSSIADSTVSLTKEKFRSRRADAPQCPMPRTTAQLFYIDLTLHDTQVADPYVGATSTATSRAIFTAEEFVTAIQTDKQSAPEAGKGETFTLLQTSTTLKATDTVQSLASSPATNRAKHFIISERLSPAPPQATQSDCTPELAISNCLSPPGSRPRTRLASDCRSIPILLIFSMAVSDALLAALVMPLAALEIMNNGIWRFDADVCKMRLNLDIVLSSTSVLHVTCLAFDRYLSVCRPYLHRRLTMKSGLAAVAACWVASLAHTAILHIPKLSTTGLQEIPSFPCGSTGEETGASKPQLDRPSFSLCSQESRLTGPLLVIAYFLIPISIIFFLYAVVIMELKKIFEKHFSLLGQRSHRNPNWSKFRSVTNLRNSAGSRVGEDLSAQENPTPRTMWTSWRNITASLQSFVPTFSRFGRQNRELNFPQNINNSDHFATNNPLTEHRQDSPNPSSQRMRIQPERGRELGGLPGKKPSRRHLKAVKTLGGVAVCLALCWLPFSIFMVVTDLRGYRPPFWTRLAVFGLGYLNSSLNPLLYHSHVTIKSAVRDLLLGG